MTQGRTHEPRPFLLPVTRFLNPNVILRCIPGQSPADVISLLAKCGIEVYTHDVLPEPNIPRVPERDLAASVIYQAIYDATTTEDHKERFRARWWLLNDTNWFFKWCLAIDLDPLEVRSIMQERFSVGTSPVRRNQYRKLYVRRLPIHEERYHRQSISI